MKLLINGKSLGIAGDVWVLLLRIIVGALMLSHGWSKFQTLLDGGGANFPDPLGIGHQLSLIFAVLTEVLFSGLLILGFLSRLTTFGLAFTMFVAAFIQHADDPFSKKELAILYLIIYITLLVKGSGKFSVDHFIRKK